MKVDMHFHSTSSDGYWDKDLLLQEAKKRDLDFIALTDHDVISYGFREKAKYFGIESCQSVEISAYNQAHDKSLHLTLYAKEISGEISNILENVISQKQVLIEGQIEKFKDFGFEIEKDDFLKYFGEKGRNKDTLNKFDITFFAFLIEKNRKIAQTLNGGKEINVEDFYTKFLKRGGEGFERFAFQIPPYETPLELTNDFVKKTNGILSIPHANVTFSRGGIEEFEKVLPYYIENGINALEVNACMNKKWVDTILKNKEKYNLYMTFGSDFHKPGISDGKHGNFGEQNPHINKNFVKKEFEKYKKKIL